MSLFIEFIIGLICKNLEREIHLMLQGHGLAAWYVIEDIIHNLILWTDL